MSNYDFVSFIELGGSNTDLRVSYSEDDDKKYILDITIQENPDNNEEDPIVTTVSLTLQELEIFVGLLTRASGRMHQIEWETNHKLSHGAETLAAALSRCNSGQCSSENGEKCVGG